MKILLFVLCIFSSSLFANDEDQFKDMAIQYQIDIANANDSRSAKDVNKITQDFWNNPDTRVFLSQISILANQGSTPEDIYQKLVDLVTKYFGPTLGNFMLQLIGVPEFHTHVMYLATHAKEIGAQKTCSQGVVDVSEDVSWMVAYAIVLRYTTIPGAPAVAADIAAKACGLLVSKTNLNGRICTLIWGPPPDFLDYYFL